MGIPVASSRGGSNLAGSVFSCQAPAAPTMSKINWKLIAFISALWWFIYSAPTEDSLATWLFGGSSSRAASYADDF